MNIIEKMLCVPCILYFEIFKCTKKLTCSIVYYMIRVYSLMSYKFDILYSTVLGFNVTVIKDEFIYVYYVSDTFM